MKQLLQYGIRSYGIDLLGTLALQVDQVLVVSLLSADAMGSYVVVLSLSRMLNVFQTSVVMVLFPKAAGHSTDKVLSMTGECSTHQWICDGSVRCDGVRRRGLRCFALFMEAEYRRCSRRIAHSRS